MGKFRKNLVTNTTLICVLAFSIIHLLLLVLNLFNVTNFNLPNNFSYLTAFILMVLCFILYVIGFLVENIKALKIPSWFKMLFYIAFFVFTNVYYILGLYQNMFFMLVFVAYIALILNICALSIYYNINKDEKNKLKSSTKELIFNVAFYAMALCSSVLFLISIYKIIFVPSFVFASLSSFVFEMLTMLVTTAITLTLFAFSHKKSKVLINNCLIKIMPKTISRSIKNND